MQEMKISQRGASLHYSAKPSEGLQNKKPAVASICHRMWAMPTLVILDLQRLQGDTTSPTYCKNPPPQQGDRPRLDLSQIKATAGDEDSDLIQPVQTTVS